MSRFYSSALVVRVLRTRSGLGHAQDSWRPLDPEMRLSGEAVHWKNFFGRHSAWLQAIQDSVENIMEKREEIADSG